jgi:hypothetical protein
MTYWWGIDLYANDSVVVVIDGAGAVVFKRRAAHMFG